MLIMGSLRTNFHNQKQQQKQQKTATAKKLQQQKRADRAMVAQLGTKFWLSNILYQHMVAILNIQIDSH